MFLDSFCYKIIWREGFWARGTGDLGSNAKSEDEVREEHKTWSGPPSETCTKLYSHGVHARPLKAARSCGI